MSNNKGKYSKESVYESTLNYFNDDELATEVWMDKYALKNKDGFFIERTPDDTHRRLAKLFFQKESNYSLSAKENLSEYGKVRTALTETKIYQFFKNFKYLVPQGSIMANLGNDHQLGSLSNCVVLPKMYDSYGGILRTDEQLAQLCKRRCGVGIDISSLRPNSSPVTNAAKTSSGAVSFMDRFSNTTREVAQNGRRGALMLTIDVAHPDVLDFIKVKSDLTKVTGANISVKLSDDFMVAVIKGEKFPLQFPIDSENPKQKYYIDAKEIWGNIIKEAHQTAEPGILFWDRHHKYSPSSIYPQYKNLTTNPCSEIAMQGGDSCRLMALNLFGFVDNPFTNKANFDFEKFYEVTYESMRLMDDLVDLEIESIERILSSIKADSEPDDLKKVEKEIWETLKINGEKGRRTGIGFTGLADALAALNIQYSSDSAMVKTDAIMRTKFMAEFDSSIDMAIERGVFEGYDSKVEQSSDFIKMMSLDFPELYDRMEQFGRRNVSISTVAPTGSVSILTQTSSGIEPVFQLKYQRKRKVNTSSEKTTTDKVGDYWQTHEILHLGYKQWQIENPNSLPNTSPYHNNSALEIDWNKRLQIQKIVQKYTTHSISSTINLPSNTTQKEVSEIYIKAWQLGLKGITIYRDGARDGVLISESSNDKCPQCSSKNIIKEEGCTKCLDCGYYACG